MKLQFIEHRKEAGDAVSFIFEPQEPMSWIAGQFLVYFLPHENEDIRGRQRYFTISSAPFENHVMLTTRIFQENPSTFKQALIKLEQGDLVDVKGPDGDFVLNDPNKYYVFIAGGIGITPFRSIINQLNHEQKPLNIELLYANKTDDFVFKEELENLSSRNSNFHIRYVVSPEHIDQKYIEQNVENYKEKIFYVSGPEPMVEAFDKMLKQDMKLKEENVKTDYFPGYEAI